MASTNFITGTTVITAEWLNDVNRLHYTIFGDPSSISDIEHDDFSGSGTYTHAALDAHYEDTDIHFSDATANGTIYGRQNNAWVSVSGGVTDHGALTGLSDDDHGQYHNDTRGDARYLKLDGSSPMTGSLSAPEGFDLRGPTSTQAMVSYNGFGLVLQGHQAAASIASIDADTTVTKRLYVTNEDAHATSVTVSDGAVSLQDGLGVSNGILADTLGIVDGGSTTLGGSVYSQWVPKAYCYINGTAGTFYQELGFSSITKVATGTYDLYMDTAVTDKNNLIVVGSGYTAFSAIAIVHDIANSTTSKIRVRSTNYSGTNTDSIFSIFAYDAGFLGGL